MTQVKNEAPKNMDDQTSINQTPINQTPGSVNTLKEEAPVRPALCTSDYDYVLPEELIAQHPEEQRDHSRLLVVHRETGKTEDRHFFDLTEYLRPGDLLVMNDTKVLPARLYGRRKQTGGHVEFLLLKRIEGDDWEVMVKPGKKARPGDVIVFSDGLSAKILSVEEQGLRRVRFEYTGIFEERLQEIGEMPLPPYIHEKLADQERYQTVYAREEGSAAAPTAGLHFTPELIQKIQDMGIRTAYVTLHVGLGTFRPVKEENLSDHQMHEEFFIISEETAELVRETKKNGGRVIAVGTTSVRALESAAQAFGQVQACRMNTRIFIYPGVKFLVTDALITNFHLPKSTLLMLVSAFYDRKKMLEVYRHAVENKYRFFSFGDAMFIE